ncbi:unnamed protein product [Sphagnum jensenii]|jgi:hypothetical protein|uniref:Uncharacterized protein n=1 Tax=Sphagnum jensenii TaxID=128206 RepID=A0ABP0WN65_9BRYO
MEEAARTARVTHLDVHRLFKYPCDEPPVVSSDQFVVNDLGAITVIFPSIAAQGSGKTELVCGNVPEPVGNVGAVPLDVSSAVIDNSYFGMVRHGLCGSQKLKKAQDGEHWDGRFYETWSRHDAQLLHLFNRDDCQVISTTRSDQ